MDGMREIEARNCAARRILDAVDGTSFIVIEVSPRDEDQISSIDVTQINVGSLEAVGIMEYAKASMMRDAS